MGTGVPVAPITGNVGSQSWSNKGTEIERIMAKIEQDNRILAELDHSRSTTLGKLDQIYAGEVKQGLENRRNVGFGRIISFLVI